MIFNIRLFLILTGIILTLTLSIEALDILKRNSGNLNNKVKTIEVTK